MAIVLGAPKLLDIAPYTVAAELPDISDIGVIGHSDLVGFVYDAIVDGGEGNLERLGEVPLEVIVAVPGESFVIERIKTLFKASETESGKVELPVQLGVEGKRVGERIEVDFRKKLQYFDIEIFQWLDELGLAGEGIVEAAGTSYGLVYFYQWVAAFSPGIGIADGEIFDIPWLGFIRSAGGRPLFAYIGEGISRQGGDLLCNLLDRIPFLPGSSVNFVFQYDIQVVGVVFRNAGGIGFLCVERQSDAPFVRQEFAQFEAGGGIVAHDIFPAALRYFLVYLTKADGAVVAREGDVPEIGELHIHAGDGGISAPFIESGEAKFIGPDFCIEGEYLASFSVSHADHSNFCKAEVWVSAHFDLVR